ncbi:hypothetical protein GH808_08180 [Acetobacterium fimetarium]|uniref:Tyr recombinase domain-containing protein n=1 Tax=Acetobacterium fimetarium TaxID=52691 RepID=A0ABR6WUX1_9FIRM|nr:hypothetical protein [Acetobacterium fimetarium]
MKLSTLAPHHIKKFYNKLNEGYSPKTIKNIHGVLHKGLQPAVTLGYIRVNPAESCKLPKVVKAHIKPMDKTIIPTFIKAIKGHQFENLYLVDLFIGLRQSEIIGLTWDCIDFDADTIFVYRQYQKLTGGYKWATLICAFTICGTLSPCHPFRPVMTLKPYRKTSVIIQRPLQWTPTPTLPRQ